VRKKFYLSYFFPLLFSLIVFNLKSKIMKNKSLLLFVAFIFVLSSCSDYRKVGKGGNEIPQIEIKRQSTISPGGNEYIYILTSLGIDDKVIKLKNDSIVLSANSKNKIETESIGDIKIKISQGKEPGSIVVGLWMTEEQIRKIK